MTNDTQNRTRASLSGAEASFLSEIGERGFVVFSLDDTRQILGTGPKDHTRQFLERLRKKGWIRGIKKGSYALIPLSSGHEPNPQIHEFVIAMELVSPAAVAYWSALNHHGLTEQLPRTVFVATNHPVRRHQREILGIPYRIICSAKTLRMPSFESRLTRTLDAIDRLLESDHEVKERLNVEVVLMR